MHEELEVSITNWPKNHCPKHLIRRKQENEGNQGLLALDRGHRRLAPVS